MNADRNVLDVVHAGTLGAPTGIVAEDKGVAQGPDR